MCEVVSTRRCAQDLTVSTCTRETLSCTAEDLEEQADSHRQAFNTWAEGQRQSTISKCITVLNFPSLHSPAICFYWTWASFPAPYQSLSALRNVFCLELTELNQNPINRRSPDLFPDINTEESEEGDHPLKLKNVVFFCFFSSSFFFFFWYSFHVQGEKKNYSQLVKVFPSFPPGWLVANQLQLIPFLLSETLKDVQCRWFKPFQCSSLHIRTTWIFNITLCLLCLLF